MAAKLHNVIIGSRVNNQYITPWHSSAKWHFCNNNEKFGKCIGPGESGSGTLPMRAVIFYCDMIAQQEFLRSK